MDFDHFKECFPGYEIKLNEKADESQPLTPPFKLTFEDVPQNQNEEADNSEKDINLRAEISVSPYTFPSRGPYVYNMPKK